MMSNMYLCNYIEEGAISVSYVSLIRCRFFKALNLLRETALLQIMSLSSHALQGDPEDHSDSFRYHIAEDGALGDTRSEEPESNHEVDCVGCEKPIAKESEEEGVARGCLLCAASRLSRWKEEGWRDQD